MTTEIKYPEEHINCQNYDDKKLSILKIVEWAQGGVHQFRTCKTSIVLVLKGNIKYSYGSFTNIKSEKDELFLVPLESSVEVIVGEDCELLCMEIDSNKKLCDCFSLHNLPAKKGTGANTPYHLTMNTVMKSFADLQKVYYQSLFRCFCFHEIKIEEFFYILRLYYSKTDLGLFFHPIISQDISFSNKVMHVAEKANSVGELAEAMGYSVSGFNKRFRKVFNVPPYKWLEARKAERIYKIISRSNEPFKSLISKIGFKYLSDLNTFCHKHYGMTPGEVRNSNKA